MTEDAIGSRKIIKPRIKVLEGLTRLLVVRDNPVLMKAILHLIKIFIGKATPLQIVRTKLNKNRYSKLF